MGPLCCLLFPRESTVARGRIKSLTAWEALSHSLGTGRRPNSDWARGGSYGNPWLPCTTELANDGSSPIVGQGPRVSGPSAFAAPACVAHGGIGGGDLLWLFLDEREREYRGKLREWAQGRELRGNYPLWTSHVASSDWPHFLKKFKTCLPTFLNSILP